MCFPALAPLGALLTGGGAATAAGATVGASLATLGTLATAGASIYSGIAANRTARENARLTRERARTEAVLTATQDNRERRKFQTQIRQQAAELIGRGVSLDSPTAVLLGQQAAQELSFGSQAIRSQGAATQAELSGQERLYRAQGRQALLSGVLSGAAGVLTKAPDVWPELLA
jgi:hypothetical protein